MLSKIVGASLVFLSVVNDERDRELYWRGGVLNLFLIFYNDVTDDVIMVIIPNKVMGGSTMAMTIESSNFPNGHCQK